jgi:hypothetical protein
VFVKTVVASGLGHVGEAGAFRRPSLGGLRQTSLSGSQLRSALDQRAGVLGTSLRVDGMAARQNGLVLAAVTLARSNELDRGCAYALRYTTAESPGPSLAPAPRSQTGKSRVARNILQGSKQSLRVGVVVTLPKGRLKEGTTPSFCRVASMVAALMGAPLSECRTRGWPAIPSRR